MNGISWKFLWYVFKPYFCVFGILLCLNLGMVTFITSEHMSKAVALLNTGLCFTAVHLIRMTRDEKYAFDLLQGDVQTVVDKKNIPNYLSNIVKYSSLFFGVICLNVFAAQVSLHPFFETFPERAPLWMSIYVIDMMIGSIAVFFIQKGKEKPPKLLKIDIKKTLKEQVIKNNYHHPKSNPKPKVYDREQSTFDKRDLEDQVETHKAKVIEQEILKRKQIEFELQSKQEEQAKLSALKHLDTKNRHEKNTEIIRGKLKTNNSLSKEEQIQRRSDLMALKTYHLFALQEQAISIANRPLRALCDFGLDEFTDDELSHYNQTQLKTLSEMLKNRFNILEIELYGSYPVYLASLRLGMDIENVRRPGDLDLRFEVETEDLDQVMILIQDLFLIGFILKNYIFSLNNKVKLRNYIIQKKMTGGYLNLSCLPSEQNNDYEMELTVIFKNHYRVNYNPFNLLNHRVKIQNNRVSFDGDNLKLRKQLARDILNARFNIDVDAIVKPEVYNVFNFFSRLLRNRQVWGPFYNMYLGNVNVTLINLPVMIDFFKLRFALHQQKECFLELVSIIIQNNFFLPETKLIINGFLFALLQAINLESDAHIAQEIFNPDKMEQDVHEITQKLQHTFSTVIAVLQGDPEYNKKVFKKFYISLMEILIYHKPDCDAQVFFCNARQTRASILFNAYKKPICFRYVNPVSANNLVEQPLNTQRTKNRSLTRKAV